MNRSQDTRFVSARASDPELTLLSAPDWKEYALLDSGNGTKLERFGPYLFARPESQALWQPALPQKRWDEAHAIFQGAGTSDDQESGRWRFQHTIEPRWRMRYKDLSFWAEATPFRHLGLFPEQANHWDWLRGLLTAARRPTRVLNLFGYTGLASLAAARAGATVTHVDASKKVLEWARENQALSGLQERPIRWISDDALKFVQREARRGTRYDGLIIDPPKFGRGPKGELWKIQESLPALLQACHEILSEQPLFVVITAYAIRASALSLYYPLQELLSGYQGRYEAGEMVLREQSAQRLLSTAIFARWSANRA